MNKHINMKPAKISIYGRAPLLKQVRQHSNDYQAVRYYNYLLMIEHYHKTNTQPHANRVLKPVEQQMPVIGIHKEHQRNISWSYLMPHWIGELFTRQKVENDILRNTA